MDAAPGDGAGVCPRWLPWFLSLTGHAVVLAALIALPAERTIVAPRGPLSARWLGAAKQEAPMPKPHAGPRSSVTRPMARTQPRSETVPLSAFDAAVIAAPADSPTSIVSPAAGADSAPAEPLSVIAPRFDAAYRVNPAPVYPPASRAMGERGEVTLRVLVSARGEPQEVMVSISSGHARLDQAALDAVWRWRFEPARQGENAVAAWVIVPIVFTLRGSP